MFPSLNGRYSKERPNFNDVEWLIPIEEYTLTGLYKCCNVPSARYLFKCFTEVVVSAGILACALPFLIIIAAIIKFTSKGPIFFRQERIGQEGIKFNIIKFRTMRNDAEKDKASLSHLNEAGGPVFKIENDPRVTKFGKLLRKTGLDELPQLWNVIKGDMSLIGPRPPLESEVRQYEKWQLRRLTVRPGITCTWQIQPQRHEVSFENWMQMDLEYIDNWSLEMDVKLFFGTIKSVFVAGGH